MTMQLAGSVTECAPEIVLWQRISHDRQPLHNGPGNLLANALRSYVKMGCGPLANWCCRSPEEAPIQAIIRDLTISIMGRMQNFISHRASCWRPPPSPKMVTPGGRSAKEFATAAATAPGLAKSGSGRGTLPNKSLKRSMVTRLAVAYFQPVRNLRVRFRHR